MYKHTVIQVLTGINHIVKVPAAEDASVTDQMKKRCPKYIIFPGL